MCRENTVMYQLGKICGRSWIVNHLIGIWRTYFQNFLFLVMQLLQERQVFLCILHCWWVWVGECFFWYRPTRVVPDLRPLNGRCCCCCLHCWCLLLVNLTTCFVTIAATTTSYYYFQICKLSFNFFGFRGFFKRILGVIIPDFCRLNSSSHPAYSATSFMWAVMCKNKWVNYSSMLAMLM